MTKTKSPKAGERTLCSNCGHDQGGETPTHCLACSWPLWAAYRRDRNWDAHKGDGARGWVVAPLHPSDDGSHYAPITHSLTEEDARLIAAAPQLLAALKPFVTRPLFEGFSIEEWNTINAVAQAAIAKAEGRAL